MQRNACVRALTRHSGGTEGASKSRSGAGFARDAELLVKGCDGVADCAARVHATAREEPGAALDAYRATNVDIKLRLPPMPFDAALRRTARATR